MHIRKRHLSAILISLSLIGPAQAEPAFSYANSQHSYLNQTQIIAQDQTTSLNFAFDSDQHQPDFEQVQSVIDDRINVAMNIGLSRGDELNLSIGALSLAFPENSNKAIDVNIRPFFYVGIGSRW